MFLRNMPNWQPIAGDPEQNKISVLPSNKIEHQIDNEGCRCSLCQKIVINEMKVIKKYTVQDTQSQLTRGQKEEYFDKFIMEFGTIDRMNRKIKIGLPEVCIFSKGAPTTLISKKRETLPMKMIRNKEKLNGFEINNFFIDGFMFHNNWKQSNQARLKSMKKSIKPQKQNVHKTPYKFRKEHYEETLKNECIVLAKFMNGTCQMLTYTQLNNLFKSKQRNIRSELLYLNTLISTANYNQIRICINLLKYPDQSLLERAKNEVKMINEDIKPKDFLFVPERDERRFQEIIKDENINKYLEYLSIKIILLYSLRTEVLFEDALFKYVKDQIDSYYLVDIQVFKKGSANKVWGQYNHARTFVESPEKPKKIRPTSSPQRLQKRCSKKKDYIEDGELVIPEDNSMNPLQRKLAPKPAYSRVRTIGSIKLEPILKPYARRYEA